MFLLTFGWRYGVFKIISFTLGFLGDIFSLFRIWWLPVKFLFVRLSYQSPKLVHIFSLLIIQEPGIAFFLFLPCLGRLVPLSTVWYMSREVVRWFCCGNIKKFTYENKDDNWVTRWGQRFMGLLMYICRTSDGNVTCGYYCILFSFLILDGLSCTPGWPDTHLHGWGWPWILGLPASTFEFWAYRHVPAIMPSLCGAGSIPRLCTRWASTLPIEFQLASCCCMF